MKRAQNLFLLSVLSIAISIPYSTANEYESPTKPYPKPHHTPPKTTANVVVEGIVYCQSCKHSGTWSLDEAKPIEGAKIGVLCRNYKDRISYYKTYSTDSGGYFYAKLDGFTMRHQLLDHPLQACVVKLVSSPIDECDVFTNINYGVNGAALRYEKKKIMNKSYEAVIYASGPLAFRPEYCMPNLY